MMKEKHMCKQEKTISEISNTISYVHDAKKNKMWKKNAWKVRKT